MSEKLPAGLSWLFSTSPWVPAILAIALAGFMVWLNWPAKRLTVEQLPAPDQEPIADDIFDPKNEDYSDDPERDALDRIAYNEIMRFVLDDLVPACEALGVLQDEIISRTSKYKNISNFTIEGIRRDPSSKSHRFWKHYIRLMDGLTNSPGPIMTFDGIIDCIYELELGSYRNALDQTARLSLSTEAAAENKELLKDKWGNWMKAHNHLVSSYENIKRDSRFGKLLRPARRGRWGRLIHEIQEDKALPLELLRDIEA